MIQSLLFPNNTLIDIENVDIMTVKILPTILIANIVHSYWYVYECNPRTQLNTLRIPAQHSVKTKDVKNGYYCCYVRCATIEQENSLAQNRRNSLSDKCLYLYIDTKQVILSPFSTCLYVYKTFFFIDGKKFKSDLPLSISLLRIDCDRLSLIS